MLKPQQTGALIVRGKDLAGYDDVVRTDRAFDPGRRCATERARLVVVETLKFLQNYEEYRGLRKRRRRPFDQVSFELSVEALLADAIHGQLVDPDCGMMVSLANKDLGSSSRYRPPVMTKALPDILLRLAAPEMAYLVVDKGHQGLRPGEGRRTTFKAGERLIARVAEHGLELEDLRRVPHKEVIILKAAREDHWDTGKRLEYGDTEQTRRFRDEVRTINAWLAGADIDFDEAWASAPVDDQRRELRRVFNAGRFDAGGRLFGGFWQDLKKRERALGLTIGGHRVVTLDYRQMGPRILYGWAGVQPPDDCYSIPRYEVFRDGWKRLFGALTHAGLDLSRYPQGTRSLFPDHLRIGEAIKALADFHAPIAGRFTPGIGLDLMFAESEIMIDLLLAAQEKSIVALPIHDAVIVAQGHRDAMAEIMVQTFKDHVGIQGEVSVEMAE